MDALRDTRDGFMRGFRLVLTLLPEKFSSIECGDGNVLARLEPESSSIFSVIHTPSLQRRSGILRMTVEVRMLDVLIRLGCGSTHRTLT